MRNDYESNYLAHHGILGMRWGHRNGPPYPLAANQHSAAEKKAGWRSSLAGAYKAHKKKKTQQKALKKARAVRAENAKKAAEQKQYEENKEKALKSGKASEVLKYQGDLTNQQLETAYKRLEWEKKLGDMSSKEMKDGWDKMDEIFKKVDKTTDYVKSATNFYDALKKSLKSFGITKEDEKKSEADELKKALDEVANSRDPKKIRRYQSLMSNDQLALANRGLTTKEQIDKYLKTDKEKKKEAKAAEKEAAAQAKKEQEKEFIDWVTSFDLDDVATEIEPQKTSSKSDGGAHGIKGQDWEERRSPQMYDLNADIEAHNEELVEDIEKKLKKLGYM